MNKDEKVAYETMIRDHYRLHWNKTITRFLRFQNPNIANAEALSALKYDESHSEVYFHCAWLKPGRNSYVIEHITEEARSAMEGSLVIDLVGALDGRESPIAEKMRKDCH